jgi:hypothetical protein
MKLLAERENDGILVRLFWDASGEPGRDVIIRYRDWKQGLAFSFRPPREQALRAFYHPHAYAPPDFSRAA